MTLNTRQVSFYMAQRNKGLTQEAAAATTGISVRSGRRIEKGQWQPGAFYHATLRNDILPDDEWRQLWQRMCSRLAPQLASRLMVNALKLAAEREDISAVAKGLNHLLLEPGEPDLQKLLNWLGVKDKRPLPDGKLVQHSLQGYDNLMRKGGLQ